MGGVPSREEAPLPQKRRPCGAPGGMVLRCNFLGGIQQSDVARSCKRRQRKMRWTQGPGSVGGAVRTATPIDLAASKPGHAAKLLSFAGQRLREELRIMAEGVPGS